LYQDFSFIKPYIRFNGGRNRERNWEQKLGNIKKNFLCGKAFKNERLLPLRGDSAG
jgi:hypothetical protein